MTGRLDQPSHLPPQSLEAEEAILGAMMMSPKAIETATTLGLTAADFYRESHQIVFSVIVELADRGAADELTVSSHLEAQRRLDSVGGRAAVLSLVERVPAVANARAYAQEVIDQAVLRRLVETGHEIARLGYEHPEEPAKLVIRAGMLADELATQRRGTDPGFTTLAEELNPLYDRLAERHERGDAIVGRSTGFRDLDARWGGVQDGRLYVIAGRPGMGKSGMLGELVEHVTLDDEDDAVVFNLEMGAQQQAARTIARRSDVDLYRLTNGIPNDEDFAPIHETRMQLHAKGGDRLHMHRATTLTSTEIKQHSRRLARSLRRKGRRLALIGVDYLQLVDPPRATDNRANDVAKISRDLKALALELEVPVIALCQLNREVERRNPPRPVLADLRESGAIEQDADVVAFLFRPEYYLKADTPPEWVGKTEFITAKWRDGQPGSDVLGFVPRVTRFTDGNVPSEYVAGAPHGRVA